MGKDHPEAEACCAACREAAAPLAAPPARGDLRVRSPAEVKIVVTGGRHGEQVYEPRADQTEVVFGRLAARADVVLASGTISKRQFALAFRPDGEIACIDLHSTCGTYLDGRKQQTGTLREGTVILAGDYQIRVVRR